MSGRVIARASPNLALVKYWGKLDARENLPATPSLGVTLDGLWTETAVSISEGVDSVYVNGSSVAAQRVAPFFKALRKRLGSDTHFHAESRNSFPTAAGLASSSSGFAALACGCVTAAGTHRSRGEISEIARVGSASAARAVFPGFVVLPAGGARAVPVQEGGHWPEFRVIVVTVSGAEKDISSRDAMERVRRSSPFYADWVSNAPARLEEALDALTRRDIECLGETARASYLAMFATMFTASPPVLLWLPESVTLIRECERLRREGIGAWETMDAGPQVKVICLEADVPRIVSRIGEVDRTWEVIVTGPGVGASAEIEG